MTTDHNSRLLAAKVLGLKGKHIAGNIDHTSDDDWVTKRTSCQKCSVIIHEDTWNRYSAARNTTINIMYDPCPIPDLPTEPLEVLAFRCRDKVGIAQWSLQMAVIYVELYDPATTKLGADAIFSKAINVQINGDHLGWLTMRSKASHWIIAAGLAKGIEMERINQ